MSVDITKIKKKNLTFNFYFTKDTNCSFLCLIYLSIHPIFVLILALDSLCYTTRIG